MSQLLKDIEEYWTNRAAGYSEYNRGELAGGQRERWSRELLAHLPDGTFDAVVTRNVTWNLRRRCLWFTEKSKYL